MAEMGALSRGGLGACVITLGLLCGCRSVAPARGDAKVAEGEAHEATSRVGPGAPILFGGWYEVQPEAGTRTCLLAVRDLDHAGAHERALERLDEELSRTPGSCSLLEARAALYAARGFARAAEADFREVTEREPWRVGAWVGLGKTRESLGLENAAAEAFAEARARGYPGDDLLVAGGSEPGS